ncbi:2-dehydropantoate 2-reductase [candidate division GN15 bacterium]|uniref:2-dehydropantoate 2-reductase n=1 Tax=candidate division GN15 bacterium TaxID=2072418 RepID=A0A855X2Y1_9BACT|nr:MAG: 2-dehydropantoate 2-reductase [candidate division GN15 bacterium]
MKIAVIGTGGVGGYFGGRIARAGHEVTFVARGAHFKAIRENGLQVKSINGDFAIKPAKTTDNIRSLSPVDLILLGVKAWQVREVAQQLKEVVADTTAVMPLQNGVMAAEELTDVLGNKYVIGGLCRIISKIESPGVIAHSGLDPYVAFGELDNRKTERIARIKALFDSAGITSQIAEDISADLWTKFMAICVSGLLAVTRSRYGTVRELKETRQMINDLLGEVHQVALQSGIRLEPGIVEKTMVLIDSYPFGSTSSLTRDVMEGRPSEIEYQNGTVVRLGTQFGVDVPVNRFIYNCILPMEMAARAKTNLESKRSN